MGLFSLIQSPRCHCSLLLLTGYELMLNTTLFEASHASEGLQKCSYAWHQPGVYPAPRPLHSLSAPLSPPSTHPDVISVHGSMLRRVTTRSALRQNFLYKLSGDSWEKNGKKPQKAIFFSAVCDKNQGGSRRANRMVLPCYRDLCPNHTGKALKY